MSKLQDSSALEGFTRLGRATYIFEPPASVQPTPSPAPDLVIVAAWMDAQLKHIAKYTKSYKHLYPHARILVITTSVRDFLFSTQARNAQRIAPALNLLYALPPPAKILLHTFSNGGATTACAIAAAYRAQTGLAAPVRGFVIDSAPGSPNFRQGVTAFGLSLPPNPLAQALGTVFIAAFMLTYMFVHVALGRKDVLSLMRARLLDKTMFPPDAGRLYVYSKEDKLVGYRDVEAHAALARKAGWETRAEMFDGTSHVAHMMGDPKKYWAAVQILWSNVK